MYIYNIIIFFSLSDMGHDIWCMLHLWLQARKADSSVKLRDVVMSSAAAPVFFPSHNFEADGRMYNLVDGGVAANNPVNPLHTQAFKGSYFQDLLPFVYTIHSSYLMKLSPLCRHCLQYKKQTIYLETEIIIIWFFPWALALKKNTRTSLI